AFTVPLGTGDLRAAQTTGQLHPDAFRACLHGVLHGALHGPTEHHSTLQLTGDVLAHQTRIQIGLAHFLDIDVYGHAHFGGHVTAQALLTLALLTAHDAGTRGGDGDTNVLGGTLDLHSTHGRVLQPLEQVITYL